MKAHLFLGAAAALLLAGCEQKSNTPPPGAGTNTSAGNLATAPVDYLKAIAKDKQSAEATLDTTSLNKAIQLFNVDQGRNPKDLNELAQKKYLPKVPDAPYGMKLVYDADKGTVKLERQ
jgi:hypothetical protein